MGCRAIGAAYSGRTTVDKVVAVTVPIALFVASGFEHSVANMFMVPLGILIRDYAGSDFWAASGLEASAYADLTWANFLTDNLLPVTLGNIVGGGVMIGVLYWTLFHFLDKPGNARTSVVSGKSVSVRVDLGVRRIIKKQKTK